MSEPAKPRPIPKWDEYEATTPLVDQFTIGTLDMNIFYFTLGQVAATPSPGEATQEGEQITIPVRTLGRFAMGVADIRILHGILGRVLNTEQAE